MMNSNTIDSVERAGDIEFISSKEEPRNTKENANDQVSGDDIELTPERAAIVSNVEVKENNPNDVMETLPHKENSSQNVASFKQISIENEAIATTSHQTELNKILSVKPIEQLRSEIGSANLEKITTEAEELDFQVDVLSVLADGDFDTNNIEHSLASEINDSPAHTSKDVIHSVNMEFTDLTCDFTEDVNFVQIPIKIEKTGVDYSLDDEKPCSTQSLHFKYKFKGKDEKKAMLIKTIPTHLPVIPTSLPPAVVGGFENWTTINLPQEVEVLLSFGPKLCQHNNMYLMRNFPSFYIDNCLLVRFINPDNCLQQVLSFNQSRIAAIQKIKNDYNRRVFLHMIAVTQKFLLKYPDVRIVTTADYDKCNILAYKNDYRKKMGELLETGIKKGVYRLYEGDFCTQYKLIRNSFDTIATLLIKHYDDIKPAPFQKRIYAILTVHKTDCGESVLPCLEGTVACHEQGFPCRPVFNTSRWLAYPIKAIVELVLEDLTLSTACRGHTGSTTLIASQLHAIPNCVGYEFVIFKINNLYNVIRTDYIYSYLERFAKSDMFQPKSQISSELFLKCLQFSLDESNYFSYEGHVYAQLTGLPPGAPDTDMLISVYLNYIIECFSSILFEKYLIVFWWLHKHEFLIYMLPSEIEEFIKEFKKCTQLDLIAEREKMCHSRRMPTIAFFDLQITRGPTKTLLNQRRPVAYMSHLDSLGGAKWPKEEMFEQIRKVLKWTSTTYLLDDLKLQEAELKSNGFSIYEIANAYNTNIQVELEKLTTGAAEIKFSRQETKERHKLLQAFKKRFEIHEINKMLKKDVKRLK